MSEEMNMEQDHEIITLTLEDDTELDCVVLDVFTVKEKQYIALISVEELAQDDHDGEVFIYQFKQSEGGEPELINIDSDEEYELVSDAFSKLLEELQDEYDEEIEE